MKIFLRYFYALLAIIPIVLLRDALVPLIGYGIPYITLFPITAFVALVLGAGPAVLTTIISIFIIDYFFVPPLYKWEMDLTFQVRLAVVLLGNLVIAFIGNSLKNARQNAEKQTRALAESEQQFRGVFENASVGITLVDLQGKLAVCK